MSHNKVTLSLTHVQRLGTWDVTGKWTINKHNIREKQCGSDIKLHYNFTSISECRSVWDTKYGRFTALNILKCEHFTLLVRPLRFLVISAMRRLGMYRVLRRTYFDFELFSINATTRPRLSGSPYLETFAWQIVTPVDRVTLPGRPGNPPRRVTPPIK